jgi:hypothetical protein
MFEEAFSCVGRASDEHKLEGCLASSTLNRVATATRRRTVSSVSMSVEVFPHTTYLLVRANADRYFFLGVVVCEF